MVAWHEVPGKLGIAAPSRRARYDPVAKRVGSCWTVNEAWRPNHTVPSGTGLLGGRSRHFMPGYHHLVPAGQKSRGAQTPRNNSFLCGIRDACITVVRPRSATTYA
jgi:hypothetical protein